MSQTRKITIRELAKLGIKGKIYPEDWDHPAIQDVEVGHGSAWVVFVHDCRFWKLELVFHPEDWDSNDLKEYPPEHEMEITEVVKVVREVWEVAP